MLYNSFLFLIFFPIVAILYFALLYLISIDRYYYINKSNHNLINDNKLFSDPFHLNKKGADLYTSMIYDLVAENVGMKEIAQKGEN